MSEHRLHFPELSQSAMPLKSDCLEENAFKAADGVSFYSIKNHPSIPIGCSWVVTQPTALIDGPTERRVYNNPST